MQIKKDIRSDIELIGVLGDLMDRIEYIRQHEDAIYNDINAKIERHFGEFVLLISTEEEFFGCTGFGYKPRNEDYRIKETIFIGVITGRKLVKVGKSWAIPTERYVEWDTLGTNLEISETNLQAPFPYELCWDLNRPLKLRNHLFGQRVALELRIGDQEVTNWFIERGRKQDTYLMVFRKAMKILGRNIQSQKFDFLFEEFRKKLIKRLNELRQEKERAKEEIERIFQSMQKGIYRSEEGNITLCETEDDAEIVSFPLRERVVKIDREIERLEIILGSLE
jgi:hypothetical protein